MALHSLKPYSCEQLVSITGIPNNLQMAVQMLYARLEEV